MERIVDAQNRKLMDLAALKESRLPLVIYGTGSYAHDVTRFLKEHGVGLNGACVDDEYLGKAGMLFHGMPVVSLKQVHELYPAFNLLIGFADYRQAKNKVKGMAGVHEVFFIDAPHHLAFFDYQYIIRNRSAFEESYGFFTDPLSQNTFIAYLNAKLSGQPDPLYDLIDLNPYFNSVLPLGANEVYVDCGAFDGDTILKFHKAVNGKYEKIIAFECDATNEKRLCETVARNGITNVRVINKGVWSHKTKLHFQAEGTAISTIKNSGESSIEVDAMDHVIGKEKISFLKMDIEGSELPALHGAKNLIKKNRPKLAICVYHKPEDLITIPQYLKELVPEYRLFLRHHQCISWETVLYAFPS